MLLSSIHYVPRIAFPKQGRLPRGVPAVIEREGDTLLRQRVDVGSASAGKTFDMASEFLCMAAKVVETRPGARIVLPTPWPRPFYSTNRAVVPTSTMSRPMTPVSNVTLYYPRPFCKVCEGRKDQRRRTETRDYDSVPSIRAHIQPGGGCACSHSGRYYPLYRTFVRMGVFDSSKGKAKNIHRFVMLMLLISCIIINYCWCWSIRKHVYAF